MYGEMELRSLGRDACEEGCEAPAPRGMEPFFRAIGVDKCLPVVCDIAGAWVIVVVFSIWGYVC
jgi:hypothetical protein